MAKRILCPGCNKPVKPEDCDTKNILHRGTEWHRPCAMKDSGEHGAINKVFLMQDDTGCDPTTAMADMIGNIGHFCDAFNKGKRKNKIDFAEAIRRGVRYWEAER